MYTVKLVPLRKASSGHQYKRGSGEATDMSCAGGCCGFSGWMSWRCVTAVLSRTEPWGPARQFQYLLPPPCPPRDAGDREFKWNEDVEATWGLVLVHEA